MTSKKTYGVPIDIANKIDALAERHGVKASVIFAAMAEIVQMSDEILTPFILRAKEENAKMRSKVASERAKISHAKRKAMQSKEDGVE